MTMVTRAWVFTAASASTAGGVFDNIFHRSSAAEDAHSVATEGGQNGGDASLAGEKPRIKITIDRMSGEHKDKFRSLEFFTPEYMDRLKAMSVLREKQDQRVKQAIQDFENPGRVLTNVIIEDFGTTGLCGTEYATKKELYGEKKGDTPYNWARAFWAATASNKDPSSSGSKGLGILTAAIKSGLRMAIYYTVIAKDYEPDPAKRHRFAIRWLSGDYTFKNERTNKDCDYGPIANWGVVPDEEEGLPSGFVWALLGDEAKKMARKLGVERRDDESGTTLICVSYLENEDEIAKNMAIQISKKFWAKIADDQISFEITRREDGEIKEQFEVNPSNFGQAERVELLKKFRARVSTGEAVEVPGECMEQVLGRIPKRVLEPKLPEVPSASAYVMVMRVENGGSEDKNVLHVVRRGMTVDYKEIRTKIGFVGFVLIEGDDEKSKALSSAISAMENNLHNALSADQDGRDQYDRGLGAFLSSFNKSIGNAALKLVWAGDEEEVDADHDPMAKFGWGDSGESEIQPSNFVIEAEGNTFRVEANDVVIPFRISIKPDCPKGAMLRVTASAVDSDGRTVVKIPARRPDVRSGGRVVDGRVKSNPLTHLVLGTIRLNRHECPVEPKLMSLCLNVDAETEA